MLLYIPNIWFRFSKVASFRSQKVKGSCIVTREGLFEFWINVVLTVGKINSESHKKITPKSHSLVSGQNARQSVPIPRHFPNLR